TCTGLFCDAVLLILGVLSRSEAKCSSTTFYKNCWIRPFPGILIDLVESQKRGAQLLKFYRESTAQQCSKTCCLTQNAVSEQFKMYYDDSFYKILLCIHIYCICVCVIIIHPGWSLSLSALPIGVDPDLLVFGKYPVKNEESSLLSWTKLPSRFNDSEGPGSEKRHYNRRPFPTLSSTADSQLATHKGFESSSTSRRGPVENPIDSVTLEAGVTRELPATLDHTHEASISRERAILLSPVTVTKPLPEAHNPAHLNGSKQHPNETKGTTGKNQTSDDETGVEKPSWELVPSVLLVPIVLCTLVSFLCCFIVFFAASHQRRKRGYYKPKWKDHLIKCVLLTPRT
uniref:Seven cysteines N-terminal domain-containing protein n=1 Tax=Latimeria chalumnae TaxID=7897 RepID=H3A742_LATCH